MCIGVVEVVRAAIQHVHIADRRVPNIDVVDVNAARMESRIERLVKPQRKPAHAESGAKSESKSHSEARPS
jgi:hypothetical protein